MLMVMACTFGAITAMAAGGPKVESSPKQLFDNIVDPNAEPGTSATVTATIDSTRIGPGSELYKSYCQRCHGLQMVSPGGSFFDLRTFPPDEKPRFVESVTHGKRAMPAWGEILKPTDIDSLWSYVIGTTMQIQAATPRR